jgi:hypothetical protein
MITYEQAKAEAIRQSHQQWGRTRLRGRRRYVWSRGVLRWGGLMTLGLCLGGLVAHRFQLLAVLAAGIICAVGGYFIGVNKWNNNEVAYKAGRDELLD